MRRMQTELCGHLEGRQRDLDGEDLGRLGEVDHTAVRLCFRYREQGKRVRVGDAGAMADRTETACGGK